MEFVLKYLSQLVIRLIFIVRALTRITSLKIMQISKWGAINKEKKAWSKNFIVDSDVVQEIFTYWMHKNTMMLFFLHMNFLPGFFFSATAGVKNYQWLIHNRSPMSATSENCNLDDGIFIHLIPLHIWNF